MSHETIYKSLFVQSRGVLAKELQKHLRSERPIRRSVHNNVTGQWRSQIKHAVSIPSALPRPRIARSLSIGNLNEVVKLRSRH